MGKASKRKKERREQGFNKETVEQEKKIWENKLFQYIGLGVLVVLVLVVTVSLANHYAESESSKNDLENGVADQELQEDLQDGEEDDGIENIAENNEGADETDEPDISKPEEDDVSENDTDNDGVAREGESELMDKPIVTIEMEGGGIIKAELEPGIAPNTVKNIIHLIEDNFYDGLIFHRVIPGFMIQGGCPEGTGTGNPGYSIKGEFSSNGHDNNLSHERGILSMARSPMPDSAGSQFFIVHKESSHLNGEYAAFGRVIEGMDEVDRIAAIPTGANDRPETEQVIKKITVDTFGIKYEEPEKL